MKNTFLVLAITSLAAITFNGVKAQKAMTMGMEDIIMEDVNTSYKIPEIIWENSEANAAINLQAMENFKKQFPAAGNPLWHKTYDGGYIASFKDNTVQTTVAYNKKGKWHHTITNYNESNLPEHLWETIKSTYYAYDILKVSEVHFDNETVYIILLQNKKYLKKIRLQNGEMEEIEHLIRG